MQVKYKKMLKSLILFFRRRSISKNKQHGKKLRFPAVENSPVVTVMVDVENKKDIKLLEQNIKSLFKPKDLRFVLLCENCPDNILQSDKMLFLLKDDFNVFGILKKEKLLVLKSFSDDMFINLSENNENLLNDYLVSNINSTFKIGFSDNNMDMYDLIINFGIEKDDLQRVKIIHKYLLMLSGNKNEK